MQKKVTLILVCLIINVISYSQPTEKVIHKDTVQELVPTDVLFNKVQNYNYSISPNGKYFAEIVSTFSENKIYIIDIDQYKVFKEIPIGSLDIDNLYWLTSKRLIYESSGQILALDIDGTNSTIIAKSTADKPVKNIYSFYKNLRFNRIVDLLKENKKEILIETFDYDGYASLKRVNVFTGQKVTVLNGKKYKMNRWITDSYGNMQLGIKYNEEGVRFFKYNEKKNKFEQFQIKIDGKYFPLLINPKSYLEQNLIYEGFDYDSNIIYLTSNINSDKMKLITYNILEEKVEKTILEDVNCDVSNPHGKGLEMIFDKETKKLDGIKYETLVPKVKWFSEKSLVLNNELNIKFPEFINDIIEKDEKGEKLLVHQWNDNLLGNIGVYNKKDSTYKIMFYFNKDLNEYNLSKTLVKVVKSRDDFKLPCYINLPLNFKKDNTFPLVVIPHGGPWARDYYKFDKYSQYFASRGYAVLRVNFRGSTGFGKRHVLSGVNSMDIIMINDIIDATKYTIDKYKIDNRKVFIFGHSYGGYATYMSLAKYPDMFAAGVALSAPTKIKKWMKIQKNKENHFNYEFWKAALGTKKTKYFDQISPINQIESIIKPLLIFHGKKDAIIPIEQAEDMISKLKDNGKDAKLEILQNEGHTFYDSNGLGYVLDSSEEFFKEAIDKIE